MKFGIVASVALCGYATGKFIEMVMDDKRHFNRSNARAR